MEVTKGGLNATASAVNLANIVGSSFSNTSLTGVILLINSAYNKDRVGTDGKLEPMDMRLSRNGEFFINNTKVEADTHIPGYKIIMDNKKSTSK